MASLALVAVTHDRAPLDLLERVALDADRAAALAAALVDTSRGIDEAIVLSTCNRTELYLAGTHPHHADALDALAGVTGADRRSLTSSAITATDDDVSLHLFRVAAGLESRIVGEREILSQVRVALTRAVAAGTAGRHLSALFRRAASTGRRVRRTETSSCPSLASVALDAAGAGDSSGRVLVVGAGAMAAATTAELRARRRPFLVSSRRADPAARLVRTAADIVPIARWLDALAEPARDVRVAVFATSARGALLDVDTAADLMLRRDGRPLTLVDLSMPRNVDPAVATLPGVRVIDLAALTADRGELFDRRAAQVVADEHHRYRRWLAGQAAAPSIVELRAAIASACRASVTPALAGACIDKTAVERLVARLAGRVAHHPTVALKELVARGDEAGAATLLAAFGVSVMAVEAAQLSVAS